MSGKPNRFLTLTSRRRDDMTPDQAAAKLAWAWRLVRLRLMRLHKIKSLPFYAVFEKTKLGWPHLHILLRSKFISQKLISQWMDELLQSPIVHIVKIDDAKKAAFYVTKYCCKDAHKFGTSKRYWQSKDWRVEPKPEHEPSILDRVSYGVEKMTVVRWCQQHRELGWRVKQKDHWRAQAWQ